MFKPVAPLPSNFGSISAEELVSVFSHFSQSDLEDLSSEDLSQWLKIIEGFIKDGEEAHIFSDAIDKLIGMEVKDRDQKTEEEWVESEIGMNLDEIYHDERGTD